MIRTAQDESHSLKKIYSRILNQLEWVLPSNEYMIKSSYEGHITLSRFNHGFNLTAQPTHIKMKHVDMFVEGMRFIFNDLNYLHVGPTIEIQDV